MNPQSQDSGSDEIRRLMQDEVIARIPLLLKYTSSAGLRLQVPETDIQIIAGPQSWIASQISDAATNSCAQRGDKSDELTQCVDELLSGAEDGYEWGGSEDAEGDLQHGPVRWKELRANVRAAIAAYLASQSQAAQPSIEGLTRYDGYCSYDGGGPAEMEVSEDGEYVKYSDVAAYLAGQSQATRAVPEGLRSAAMSLLDAATVYAFAYMQDEAEDEEDCVCGEDQHERAKAVFAALTHMQKVLDAAPAAMEVTQQAAKAGAGSGPTYMGNKQASEWAWDQVKRDVGTDGWTAGDSFNYFGFFLHGWGYGRQYERQGTTAPVVLAAKAETAERAKPVARLQIEVSDRPFSEGEEYYGIVILDRARCADGMELFAPTTSTVSAPEAWVSVDERLPEKECLAVYVTPNGKQRTIRAKYARQFEIEAEGDDCESEYSDDDDTFYIKAGWLECIDNWGEYSSCYVVEGEVTHWMPLPEVPRTTSGKGEAA